MKSWTTSLLRISAVASFSFSALGGALHAQEQQEENSKPKPAAHARTLALFIR